MTTFLDGPAKGQTLQLRRAPVYMRVTELLGTWNALDQLTDEWEPGEALYAYVLAEKPGAMHLLVRGPERHRGGFWPIAKYRLCPEQPPEEIMRDNEKWRAWTNTQPRPDFGEGAQKEPAKPD